MAVKPSATIRWARSTQPATEPAGSSHPVAELPAEQPVNRLTRSLAREVPQRQLDAAHRDHEHARLRAGEDAAAQLLPAPLDVARVLADQQVLQGMDQADDAAGTGVRVRLAVAGEALVGVDPHQRGLPVVGDHGRSDIDDPHASPIGRVTNATYHIS
jgi:hypothetical protein